MRYTVLVSNKMKIIPIQEIGGEYLLPGDRLLVPKEKAHTLMETYAPRLITAEEIEIEEEFDFRFERNLPSLSTAKS